MSKKKWLLMGMVVIALILSAGGYYFYQANHPQSINGAWLEGHLQDVTLEIYYLSHDVFTYAPLSEAQLRGNGATLHITVDPETIKEHKDLICQVLDTPTTPVDNSEDISLDARMYYALCGKNGEPLFEVTMWGLEAEYPIFVNGVPCKQNPVFYEVPKEFLPEDVAKEFQSFVEKSFQSLWKEETHK